MKLEHESRAEKSEVRPYLKRNTEKQFMGIGGSRPHTARAADKHFEIEEE